MGLTHRSVGLVRKLQGEMSFRDKGTYTGKRGAGGLEDSTDFLKGSKRSRKQTQEASPETKITRVQCTQVGAPNQPLEKIAALEESWRKPVK